MTTRKSSHKDVDQALYFTWCPSSATLGGIDPIFQFNNVLPLLKQASTCWSEYSMGPELTENNNIHWHGWFKLKKLQSYKVRWHSVCLPKLKYAGFVKINAVKHRLDPSYHVKDLTMMQEILQIKLPITDFKNIQKCVIQKPIPGAEPDDHGVRYDERDDEPAPIVDKIGVKIEYDPVLSEWVIIRLAK